MRVDFTKKINVVDLAKENGLRQRDIEGLQDAGLQEIDFSLFCHVFIGGDIDGFILIDSHDYILHLNDISKALRYPFDMGGYKMLTKAILDALEVFASSPDGVDAAYEAYHAYCEGMQEDAIRDSAGIA